MLLKSGKVVTPEDTSEKDIRVDGEKIKEVGKGLKPLPGEEVIDTTGKYIFPGIIDSHTHFSLEARGTTTADDFYSGSKSAAFGGVTTFIDYADQTEVSLIRGLEKRKEQADNNVVVDYNFHLTIKDCFSADRHKQDFEDLLNAGISSIKMFTTYKDLYLLNNNKLNSLFKLAKDNEILITVHAEDDEIINDLEKKYTGENKLGVEYHPDIRPAAAEARAISNLSELAARYDCPLYIVHLSSAAGYNSLCEGLKQGVNIIAETTPHYLLLTRELLKGDNRELFLMTPPLREAKDNTSLWKGVYNGDIKIIATDHCAFSPEQKSLGNNSLDIYPGIPGVETLLPLTYTYGVKKGKMDITELVRVLSYNPARVFGLYPDKGSLESGTDADLVIYDPDVEWELSGNKLHSAAGYTPYTGMNVCGKPVLTMVRGQIVIKDGKFTGKQGYGEFIKGGRSCLYN